MHDPLTFRYKRTTMDAFGCNADEAVAMHRCARPLPARVAHATLKWGWVLVLVALFSLAGCFGDVAGQAGLADAVTRAAKEATRVDQPETSGDM